MISLPLFFYLVEVFQILKTISFAFTLVVLPMLCLICFIVFIQSYCDEEKASTEKWGKRFLAGWFVTLSLLLVIPSQKTMYLMAGATVVQEVSKNERVRKFATSSIDLIETRIQEYIKEETESETKKGK